MKKKNIRIGDSIWVTHPNGNPIRRKVLDFDGNLVSFSDVKSCPSECFKTKHEADAYAYARGQKNKTHKFKVGDKVKVRTKEELISIYGLNELGDLNVGRPTFPSNMLNQLCGRIFTIGTAAISSWPEKPCYRLEEDGAGWTVPEYALLPYDSESEKEEPDVQKEDKTIDDSMNLLLRARAEKVETVELYRCVRCGTSHSDLASAQKCSANCLDEIAGKVVQKVQASCNFCSGCPFKIYQYCQTAKLLTLYDIIKKEVESDTVQEEPNEEEQV